MSLADNKHFIAISQVQTQAVDHIQRLCRDGTAQEEGPDGDVLREKALWELLALFFVEAPSAIGGVTEVHALA